MKSRVDDTGGLGVFQTLLSCTRSSKPCRAVGRYSSDTMPGREHFIPQLIQRAFASRVSGDNHFVYQFRRGRPAFEVNTINSAVVRDFYGEGADSVDWMFTEREGAQATLIRELRVGESADDRKPQIDEFIALMTARSRNIRLVFSDLGRRGFDMVGWALGSEEGRRALVQLVMRRAAKLIAAKGLAAKSPGFDLAMSMMRSVITPVVEAGVVDQLYAALRTRVGDVDPLMKVAHVNALRRRSAEPVITRAGLAALRWRVQAVSDPLILGDAGPMARFGDSDALVSLYQGGPSVKAVFYPLSPSELLVGAPDGSSVVVPPADELNIAMAETSSEFFIASQGTEREAGYAARIGLRPTVFDEERLRRSMLEGLADLE